MYYLYTIQCTNPRVRDQYLGYTSNWKQCVDMHEKRANDIDVIFKSHLYGFIYLHGGFDNWNMSILETFRTRAEATARKSDVMCDPVYTLNTEPVSRKPYRVRAGRRVYTRGIWERSLCL